MGGVAGHMDHLYENRELTFGEMKEILEAAANGELTAEEKVDGQNLFLSYSIPEGKAKGARNKGNLKAGGLDAVGLAQKFAGRGGLEKAFTGGFATFEKAVEALSDEEKKRIFGPDANIWYNAEVMDPGNANVILYDDKTLKIHDVGHFIFDRENGDQSPIPQGTLEALDNAMERMENQLHNDDFKLARRALVDIKKIEDDGKALNTAVTRINSEMRKEGLNDESTILDYIFKRLINGIDSEISYNLKEEIVNYLLKLPGNIGLRALKKGLNPEDLQDLTGIIANQKTLLQQAIEPLENTIHDFTVDLLQGLKSIFIADNDKEVGRLKSELANAVEEITSIGSENPEAMAIMQRHLNKIKDFSTITTPVEAVVFDYNGHTYKFAGNFAPLNQILGMFRYGNLKRSTKESLNRKAQIITEKDGKRIALFPGKFKPPHRGHFDYVNKIAKRSDVDEVIVLISPVDYPEVSNAQSLRIWEEYLENGEPNITAKIADYRSPVQAVYEFVADPESASDGDTVLLVKSSKDVGDTRFDRAQSYAERNNPGVNVEDIVEDPVQSKDGIVYSARDMRKALADGDKETFLSYAPPSIDGESLWNSLVSPSKRLNSFIDDSIDEISTMAAGDVSGGGAIGFGPPNTYNPYKNAQKLADQKLEEQNVKDGDNYNTMTIDRNQLIAEELIREHIRKRITLKLEQQVLAEEKIRKVVRQLIEAETGTEEASRSTGINVLADLLQNIVPTVEDDYKMLTSSKEQRDSFKNHIVHAIENSLRPIEANTQGEKKTENIEYEIDKTLLEKMSIDLDPQDDGKEAQSIEGEFIDIDNDGKDDNDEFVELEDQNETGRNFAQASYKRVEKQIVDAYDMLADEEDKNVFYDYLVTNMLLYFDKFEDELQNDLSPVSTPEYEEEKEDPTDDLETGVDMELDL